MRLSGVLLKTLRLRKVLLGRDFYQGRQIYKDRITLGNRNFDWTFCPNDLDDNSIILSVGAGTDISFDLELVTMFSCRVFIFDPSPDSIEWMSQQKLPDQIQFFKFGLASCDGYLSFMHPDDKRFNSLRITDNTKHQDTVLNLQVHRLETIIKKLDIKKVEILKIDIEGAEYDVVEDIISAPVEINQVLIEFHHRFEGHSVKDTKDAIMKLNAAGYKIFNISDLGEEISFIYNGQ